MARPANPLAEPAALPYDQFRTRIVDFNSEGPLVKRSEINAAISAAEEFFAKHKFSLPPFAKWDTHQWSGMECRIEQLRNRQLGWDVTDFGSGEFERIGLTLFTLRNACSGDSESDGTYAEKIMFVGEGQLTPLHFHHRKMEDIINRGPSGTGDLIVKLYNSTESDELAESPVIVICDGQERRISAGGEIVLRSGESITLRPRLYHSFHAINGPCLVGEVSTRNNDVNDNRFYESLPRFSRILEDVAPLRFLCTEYPRSNETTAVVQSPTLRSHLDGKDAR